MELFAPVVEFIAYYREVEISLVNNAKICERCFNLGGISVSTKIFHSLGV